jgi:hypothetical protein
MKHLIRIVTFMGRPPEWADDPINMLLGGSGTITLPEKVRLFAVRRVAYDDSFTPIYAESYSFEKRYRSREELLKDNTGSYFKDLPILDLDNHLSIYNDVDVCAE